MSETLVTRINDGFTQSAAAELADLDAQIETTIDKLLSLRERRESLVKQARRRVEEVADVQVAPVDETDRYDQRDYNDQEQWR